MRDVSRTLARLSVRGEALRVHFEMGLDAYDQGDLLGVTRHRSALALLPEAGPDCLPFLALHWRELWLSGCREEALAAVREAAHRFPEDVETALELADVLRELDISEEALEVLIHAAAMHPTEAELWYEAGLAAERIERRDIRLECFRRVWELEGGLVASIGMWLLEDRVYELGCEILEAFPQQIAEVLGEVNVKVSDYPEDWIFETPVCDPRVMALVLVGDTLSSDEVPYVPPGSTEIHLYRWNIERFSGATGEVGPEVRSTIHHQIAEHLGLEDDELVSTEQV